MKRKHYPENNSWWTRSEYDVYCSYFDSDYDKILDMHSDYDDFGIVVGFVI